jgi:hypothetical protein
MAVPAELRTDLRACVAAGDWDNAMRLARSVAPEPGESLDEYRRELEIVLEIARGRRRELGAALSRVRAANGFTRQGFGASPGF